LTEQIKVAQLLADLALVKLPKVLLFVENGVEIRLFRLPKAKWHIFKRFNKEFEEGNSDLGDVLVAHGLSL